jgi:hypothetical protein
MTTTHPTTAEEWAVFLKADPMTLPERLRYVALGGWDLLGIVPGDGQATPEMLDAVAEATGRPRIRRGENGITNTAPAARAALRRWAARQ